MLDGCIIAQAEGLTTCGVLFRVGIRKPRQTQIELVHSLQIESAVCLPGAGDLGIEFHSAIAGGGVTNAAVVHCRGCWPAVYCDLPIRVTSNGQDSWTTLRMDTPYPL